MEPQFPNIRHLRAFTEVARQGSISQAAEVVFLSQPAITHAISKLETALNTTLFIRLHKGMSLTETGRSYLRRTNRALAEIALGTKKATGNSQNNFERIDQKLTVPQLRALVALATARSFSMAAWNIGISQPSIHRAARDLEKIIGQPLFLASGKGITLTPTAEMLVRHIRIAASELQQGFYEIAARQGRDTTRITIGSLPLARAWCLPQSIHKFLKDKEFVQVKTVEGPYLKLLRDLRHGQLDLIIGALRDPAPHVDIIQETLFEDPLAIVVRYGHPLSETANLNLNDTLNYPWIAPSKQTPTGTYLHDMLHISDMENTPIKVVSSSLVLVRGMLLAGDYVTITSVNQIQHELKNKSLIALPIDLPKSARPIGLTYRKDWEPTPTQNLFLDIVRKIHLDRSGLVTIDE